MKKILLATTILAMTAGFASADITFSGSASAGVAKNGIDNGGSPDPNTTGLADDTFFSYSNFDLVVTATGQTDSGLSFGASFDASAGQSYALADDDGFDENGGAFGTPTIYVSGTFGKISFSTDNLDFYNTDVVNSGDADVQYEGTFGGFGVGLIGDVDSGDLAAQASYTLAGIALSADYNQNGAADAIWDASASYTMGAFTGTLAADNDTAAFDVEESIKLAYSNNGIGAWAKANSNAAPDDTSFDVGASYAANGYSVTVEVSDVTAANNTVAHWTVTGNYDLGGGLSLEAGANYSGDVMVGAAMSF
jgi:outer membrane protein OmpU